MTSTTKTCKNIFFFCHFVSTRIDSLSSAPVVFRLELKIL